MDAKIDQKNQKCRKKGMPKMMPKFDAEKNRFWAAVRSSRWTPGGKGAARFRLI